MVEPSFAVFKYQHEDPMVRSTTVWAAWWTVAVLVLVSLFFLGPVGVGAGVVAVFILFAKWPKRQISLGARYFVCGHTVAYYKNVKRMVLRPGHLTLFWGDKQFFKLEEKRFPTNARKQHKITLNKALKFQKVSQKIIERVIAESPGVELAGISRTGQAEEVTQ